MTVHVPLLSGNGDYHAELCGILRRAMAPERNASEFCPARVVVHVFGAIGKTNAILSTSPVIFGRLWAKGGDSVSLRS